MRITSGKARGISLKAPRGDATRPATDAARQAVFSSLSDLVEGASVLDLFAGTGSYGLEALSRGAQTAVFVENCRGAIKCLRSNAGAVLKAIGARSGGQAEIIEADAFKTPALCGRKFDIVFADPPYSMLLDPASAEKIFSALARVANPGAVFALEAPAEFEPEQSGLCGKFGFEQIRRLGKKSKGKPSQILLRVAQRGAGTQADDLLQSGRNPSEKVS